MKPGLDQIMVDDVVKPGLRPDSSQEYYEAWSWPDSGISLIQVMNPGLRPDSILISPNTMKHGFDQIMVWDIAKPGLRPDRDKRHWSLDYNQITVRDTVKLGFRPNSSLPGQLLWSPEIDQILVGPKVKWKPGCDRITTWFLLKPGTRRDKK